MKQLNFFRSPSLWALAVVVVAASLLPSPSSAQGLDGGTYYGPSPGDQGPGYDQGPRHRRGPRQGPRQGPRMSPEERVNHRLSRMTETLSLSPNQVRRIRAILTQTQAQLQSLRPQRSEARGQGPNPGRHGERRAFRERTRELRWATEDRIHAILSCEQRETLRRSRREMRHQRRAEGRAGQRGPGAEGRRRGRRGGGHGRPRDGEGTRRR